MNNLMSQQDGRVHMVAQQADMGLLRQEQLEHAVAIEDFERPIPGQRSNSIPARSIGSP